MQARGVAGRGTRGHGQNWTFHSRPAARRYICRRLLVFFPRTSICDNFTVWRRDFHLSIGRNEQATQIDTIFFVVLVLVLHWCLQEHGGFNDSSDRITVFSVFFTRSLNNHVEVKTFFWQTCLVKVLRYLFTYVKRQFFWILTYFMTEHGERTLIKIKQCFLKNLSPEVYPVLFVKIYIINYKFAFCEEIVKYLFSL